jgi:hypothetical protein
MTIAAILLTFVAITGLVFCTFAFVVGDMKRYLGGQEGEDRAIVQAIPLSTAWGVVLTAAIWAGAL